MEVSARHICKQPQFRVSNWDVDLNFLRNKSKRFRTKFC